LDSKFSLTVAGRGANRRLEERGVRRVFSMLVTAVSMPGVGIGRRTIFFRPYLIDVVLRGAVGLGTG